MSFHFNLSNVRCNVLKSVFESINGLLDDVRLNFTPEGVYVVDMDNANISLISIELKSDLFDEYECDRTSIIIGIHTETIMKVFKSASKLDSVYFTYKEDNNEILNIKFLSKCLSFNF